jgi:hypothetical protein
MRPQAAFHVDPTEAPVKPLNSTRQVVKSFNSTRQVVKLLIGWHYLPGFGKKFLTQAHCTAPISTGVASLPMLEASEEGMR